VITGPRLRCTNLQFKIPLEPITAYLAHPFLARLKHVVDVVLFNPPYVPTVSAEFSEAQTTAGIEGSWAGGMGGVQVTDQLLPHIYVS
jgi:release factor glutamine methyltransferase